MGPPAQPYQPYAAVHEKLDGPGDARPTTFQIVKDENASGALKGKTILITGCSSGLGVETARALYETGAQLYLTARDIPKLDKVIEGIVGDAKIKDAPRPQSLEMHLDSLESVRKAAEAFKKRSSTLNILITNAGVMACPFEKTKDGFERQFGTNHLAHFLLFQLLKPLLLASAASSGTASRVVSLSSAGHRLAELDLDDPNWEHKEYNNWLAYGQSKTANIWFANAIERHYGSQNLHAVSVHPGAINTELGRHLKREDLAGVLSDPDSAKWYKSPEQGAATTVWGALSKRFESSGGVFLAGVGEASPYEDGMVLLSEVHAEHAYSEEKEEKLWKMSAKMVGVAED